MEKKRIRHAVGVYKQVTRAERLFADNRNPYWVAVVSPKGMGVNVEHLSRAKV